MEAKLRVNLPPDPNPRALSFAPPPGTWDTHFHVYGPPQVFPYADQRLYTPPAAPIEHYLALAAAIGIERGVLVQPNVHGSDPGVTLDAIAKAQGRLRGLIKADASLSTADFESLQAGGIRGMRFNFIPHLGGRLDENQFRAIVSRVAHLPWVLDLHTHPDMLDQLAVLIASIPLPVIIDHFGGVDARSRMDQPAFRTLLDLAGEDNVWIKISGANRLMARGAQYSDVVLLARALISRAPDRVLWGTDWPHSGVFEIGQMPNDGALMNMMLDFAPDPTARRKVLADNPARLFER